MFVHARVICDILGCAAREILSMAEVLKYLVDTYQPLEERDFRERRQTCWMEGLLVAQHHKVINIFIMNDVKINHNFSSAFFL